AHASWPIAAVADATGHRTNPESLSRPRISALRSRCHGRRAGLGDVAVTDTGRVTLVLRYADVGIATYASLRIVGQPERTVTWLVEEPILLAALEELADALPDP